MSRNNLRKLIDALVYYQGLCEYNNAARVIRHACNACCAPGKSEDCTRDSDCLSCMVKYLVKKEDKDEDFVEVNKDA